MTMGLNTHIIYSRILAGKGHIISKVMSFHTPTNWVAEK